MHQSVLDDLKLSQKNNEDKLFAVIDNFLTTKPSPDTWENVINSIESPIVNDNVAAVLIKQYISAGKSIVFRLSTFYSVGINIVHMQFSSVKCD